MCGGVKYVDPSGKDWKIYFPNPKAAIPIYLENETVEWVKWGRRKEEQAPFVQGGWARTDSLEAGKWERYKSQRVRLAAISFMEKDADKVSHWIDVPEGEAIEGLVIEKGDEKRLYIITEDTPPEYSWVNDRCPKLVLREGH